MSFECTYNHMSHIVPFAQVFCSVFLSASQLSGIWSMMPYLQNRPTVSTIGEDCVHVICLWRGLPEPLLAHSAFLIDVSLYTNITSILLLIPLVFKTIIKICPNISPKVLCSPWALCTRLIHHSGRQMAVVTCWCYFLFQVWLEKHNLHNLPGTMAVD